MTGWKRFVFGLALVIGIAVGWAALLPPTTTHAAVDLQCSVCGPQQLQIVTCDSCPVGYSTEPGNPNWCGGEAQAFCVLTGCHTNSGTEAECSFTCSCPDE